MKKIVIGTKPQPKPLTPDDWVNAHPEVEPIPEPMKRLTIDLPASLHSRVKSQCAIEDLRMADVIREFLETRFPPRPGSR